MLMSTGLLRSLFSAGANVTIDGDGVISAAGTVVGSSNGGLGSFVSTLQIVSTIGSQDLVPVSQAGIYHSISYANLLNGMTIDQAPAARAAAGSDVIWVAQGTNVLAAQSMSAIWEWLSGQLPNYQAPVVEITSNTALARVTHNGRFLVCSQPITINGSVANTGSGFQCQLINLSNGNVTLGSSFQTSTGGFVIAPLQSCSLQCLNYSGGTILYALISEVTSTAFP
jgi:hypothetical protein